MDNKDKIDKNTVFANNCCLCPKLISLLKYNPQSETVLKCDDCKKDSLVVALCIDCELFLCKLCHEYHNNKI